MNQIILIGRLTKDPELKYTSSGIAVCSFTLAVNRPFTKEGEQTADFITIQTWRKLAENCAKYLSKGRQVGVNGRLQIRSYDGNDGERHWMTEVVADNVEFLSDGQKREKQSNNSGGWDGLSEEVEFDPDEIPF